MFSKYIFYFNSWIFIFVVCCFFDPNFPRRTLSKHFVERSLLFCRTLCRHFYQKVFSNVLSSQVRSGQVRPSQVRPGQVRSAQARPGQAMPGQVRSVQVQVRPGQVRSGQGRSGQVRPSQYISSFRSL